ncbi:MAG TPA: OmpA family protein [Patescibacteria group bacterium]|nr:OmpA family protein [Patescibacteria group bacterium]
MLKGSCRVLVLLVLGLFAAPAIFASGRPSPKKAKDKKAASANAKRAKQEGAQSQKRLSPEALRVMNEGVGKGIGQWVPMPGTNGTPGMFTLNTGDTLPRGAYDVTGYVNKYGRAPGSLNVFDVGTMVGFGVTNRLTIFGGWDVYRHIQTRDPGALSSNACPLNLYPEYCPKPVYPGTPYVIPFGSGPVYSEDFPFAGINNGGIGPVTLGVKYGILSETRGNPVSLAIRDEVYIPTKTNITQLYNEGGMQSGAWADLLGVTVSKTFANVVTWSFDYGHEFTQDPRGSVVGPLPPPEQYVPSGPVSVTLADQEHIGTGFIFFPRSRFQLMTEYNGVIYDGNATPTTTFGPRDPVDGIWGIRVYPWHIVSVDAGYRYMLNLPQNFDRSGFVVKINAEYWPGKPAPADNVTVTSTADPQSVVQDAGQMVHLTAHGTDTLGHSLTYTWTAPAGSIRGTGPDVQWDPDGANPGKYTLTVRAGDPYGNFATSSQEITVTPKPIPPPTMACSSVKPSVLPGERVGITANVHDESGTTLTYTWRTTGGQIIGSGASVTFDSTGLAPGTYTITGRVENEKGAAADCQVQVTVQAPPPPKPQASKIDQCLFRDNSTRVDNVCKRVLDNVALRLQNETGAHVVVIGYASPGKTARVQRLAERRAGERSTNAQKYLVSKGISADRIETRTGTVTAGETRKQSNRIDIIWVPEGATY